MSTFDEVFEKLSRPGSGLLVVATLASNQVNGVVSVTKVGLDWSLSTDPDDAAGGFLVSSDDGDGIQLFSDRWKGATQPTGIAEAFVEGQPYDRGQADDVGIEVHRSVKTGAYRCTVILNSWGRARFSIEGTFLADLLVGAADSIGPDAGAGTPEPAVYVLSLKIVPA